MPRSHKANKETDAVRESEEFWKKRISKDVLPTNIRLDFKRTSVYKDEKNNVKVDFEPDLMEKLKSLTGNDDFLLYTALMSAMNICLFCYVASPVIVIGSPVLRKNENFMEENDALIVVNEMSPFNTFRQVFSNVRSNLQETYQYQNYSCRNLMKELGLEETVNKCPLFDIAMELTNIHHRLDNLKNDITLSFTKQNDEICGQATFNSSLYRQDTIERFIGCFLRVLETSAVDPDVKVADLIKLTEDEKRELLIDWNNTETDYPKDICLYQMFEEQVEKTPDATALCCGNDTLTYRELNQCANQLAHYLKSLNMETGVLVGIFIDRSLEMIIGLLGVLKAGWAYIPIDPTYPRDRIEGMLGSVDMPIILTRQTLLERLPINSSRLVCLDSDWGVIERQRTENPKRTISMQDLAYVIFTSGSTGVPKAAAVHHQGWTNLLYWISREFNICETDKVLIMTSFSFDITQRNIMLPLINGGELYLLTGEYYDPELVAQTFHDKGITAINCPPSMFCPLIEDKDEAAYEKISSLKYLFLGGEATSPSRFLKWVKSPMCNAVLANIYGVAEVSDVSIFHVLKDFERYMKASVPAGRPIYNTQVYILDEYLNPVRVGVVGEICLAGDGVGKGYINDVELTSKKFIPNHFSDKPGAMLYRTGDLGRYLPDGTIEFMGRVDYQVKVRGFRIELGDIESVIRQHPTVKEAVVIDKEFSPQDVRLVAYILPEQTEQIEVPEQEKSNSNIDLIEKVQQFVKAKLPNYMVPNFFIILNDVPLSPNGKIDRKILRSWDLHVNSIAEDAEEASLAPLERVLHDCFKKLLDISKIGRDDNFFDIGGHSLLATTLISTLNKELKLHLSIVDIYTAPTISELAERIENRPK